MDREIKFRAWDEKENHFWYFTLQEILERRMYYRGDWDERILRGKKTEYTGLKDKNGVEIYEGDIVCTPYIDCIFGDMVGDTIDKNFKWEVISKNGCFCVKNKSSIIYAHQFSEKRNIEVIGNVFEDGDLFDS